MAGVFDLELEPPNVGKDDASDEEPIEIGEEQVQVLLNRYNLQRDSSVYELIANSHI